MNWFQALIDIFKCKALRLKGELDYPLSILPKKYYIRQMDMNKICTEIAPIIVRRSEKKQDEVFNKLGSLLENVFSEKEIPNMSMNLLGGQFKSEHIQFNPTKEATKIWDGQELIFYSKYHSLVQKLTTTTPIFFDVENIHNITLPYQRSKDKSISKLIDALYPKPMEKEGIYELKGKSLVSHEPTLLNYWHVEFQIKDFEDKLIKDTKSAWRKNVIETALNIICENASMNCKDITAIPSAYFKKDN